MSRNRYQFTMYDYIVFAAMLIISITIGIYYAFFGSRQKTTKEFLMGNRNMKLFPIAISIMASFISAILILGTPAEMYMAGTLYFIYIIGACIGCVLASLCFIPLIYPLKLTSSYEVSLTNYNYFILLFVKNYSYDVRDVLSFFISLGRFQMDVFD